MARRLDCPESYERFSALARCAGMPRRKSSALDVKFAERVQLAVREHAAVEGAESGVASDLLDAVQVFCSFGSALCQSKIGRLRTGGLGQEASREDVAVQSELGEPDFAARVLADGGLDVIFQIGDP
jgi:hypothetical protein